MIIRAGRPALLFGPVAQLGERTVRIPMAAHRPVSFSPRFRSDFSPKSSKIEKLENLLFVVKTPQKAAIWAHSSAGRAFGSHPRGRGFESLWVHQSRARRTMQVRLAFVLLRRSIWSAMFSSWSARSAMLGNKKSGYRTVSLLCGSRFVFRHSHNLFRYILPKPCGILKLLLESTVKEHGYD